MPIGSVIEGLTQWLLRWAAVVSGLGSLLLTAGLVYLYKIQTDILDHQKTLTENQHQAILRVENYLLASAQDLEEMYGDTTEHPEWLIRSGVLTVFLSNFGKGAANELYAELYFREGGTYFGIQAVLTHGGHIDPLAFTDQGGVIGATEQNVQFGSWFRGNREKLPPEWAASEEAPEMLTPSEIMWAIQDSGTRIIEMGLEIHYEDGTGQREPIVLFELEVDLRDRQDIRSAHAFGTPLLE